jgi:hypothetical protein
MRAIIFALTLSLLLAPAAPAFAQERASSREWSAVQALSSGEKIVVRTDTGDKFTGRFNRATDTSITITRDGKEMSIARTDIGSVSYPGGTSRTKGALVGAAIGGGSGLGFGIFFYESGHGDFVKEVIPGFAVIGAGIGAGIGAAFGMGKKDVRIYEAP